MAKKSSARQRQLGTKETSRTRISRTDVPGMSLEESLRIANAIAENYAYKATTPLRVAEAIKVQPSSGPFRTLTGASIAYDLTSGGSNAECIELTPLGLRVTT